MKHIFLALTTALCGVQGLAQTISEGDWHLEMDATTHALSIDHRGQRLITDACATAMSGEQQLVSTAATAVSMTKADVADGFGTGRCYTISYQLPSGHVLLQQLSFYDGRPYMLAQLALTGPDGTVASNRLTPISTQSVASFLPDTRKNRMLWVPWDNDGWVRYQAYYLTRDMYSITTTAIYNTENRLGLVAGALDHDTWKSAVHVAATDYHTVGTLELISGYTGVATRDTLNATTVAPHGTVKADTVRSSRFMLGLFDDWRTGMETFAQACNVVAPRRQWAGGTPYGWNSWGVMQDKMNYEGVMDVMHFIHQNLVPHGFHDQQGRVLMSLDAWTTLSDAQIKQFVDSCKKLNMIPGMYACPFVDWGKYDRAIEGTSKYTYKDLWLKHQGEYVCMTDAYALDPTHPGTKIAFQSLLNRYKRLGIKFIKLDFMCHAAVEADSWYNKACQTGMQAYNEGMAFIRKQCGDDIYLNLSISPTFPYQYCEGRRICCDAYSSIDNTEYVMNSTSYGWWLTDLYICDPDNLVLKGIYNGGTETKGENRARLTSGAVTGLFGNGDSYSEAVSQGYPLQSRERALELLTNDDVNAIARTVGRAFRPVEGTPHDGTNGAENLMLGESADYWYLAVINYKKLLANVAGRATFQRLGIDAARVAEVKELWTGEAVSFTAEGFNYNVPPKDARIYRIKKAGGSDAIRDAAASASQPVSISAAHGGITVSAPQGLRSVQVYSLQGALVAAAMGGQSLRVDLPRRGCYVARATTADGSTQTMKLRL